MSSTEYAYAVANVRARESELLDNRFFNQLLSGTSFEEAKRMLIDKGFSEFENTSDISAALKNYMEETWEYLQEITPDKNVLDFLVVKNDFHNLKALTKGIMTDTDGIKYCLKPCLINAEDILNAVKNKSFSDLPSWISECAREGYELLSSSMDGQLFDMFVDKCSLEAMQKLAADGFSKKLADSFTALTDIKIALRMARAGVNEMLYDYALCECDTVDISELKSAALKGYGNVVSYIEETEFSELAEYAAVSAAEFEKNSENYILALLDNARRISFGAEPLIAYYAAREAECRNLRIAVSAVHIGLPAAAAKERMRELYV